jgi:4-pyridoxolactonase
VSGDVEVARGLWLFETPGHTIGHYSLLVTGEPGTTPMLFAFDVVYTGAAIERAIQPGFHIDPRAGVRSIQRVKDVAAEHGADIYFSHDPDAFPTYKRAPDYYEL